LKNFNAGNKESVDTLIRETERLKQANVKDGLLPKAWNGIKNLFRSEKVKLATPLEAAGKAGNTEIITENVDKAIKAGEGVTIRAGKRFGEVLKTSGGGVKGGLFFLGLEYLMSGRKIIDSFKKDKKTGFTQLGQTTVKGLGSAAGWALGDALGVWGTTKLLAAAGTAIAPGIGTAIGAIAGMVGGSIGCWLFGKITKKLVGQDVGDRVQAENLVQTQDGQVQLLQYTVDKMQKGEPVDPQAQAAVQRMLSMYAQ